jgi:peptidylprolyl isomerase
VLVGCNGIGSGDPVAKAGDIEVSAQEIRDIVAALPEPARSAVRSDRATLERVVRAELVRRAVLAEARDARLDSDPAAQRELEKARDDALVRLWVAKQGAVSPDYPSDEDLGLAFEANQVSLTPPVQYRVAQIFVSAPNGIDAARLATAMRKAADVGSRIPGGDFAELARQYSEHAESAQRGGDVGLLPASQMLPEIVAAVRNLEVGDTVGPVKTSQGLHYIKLLERATPPPPTLESSRETLRAALRTQRARELERAYLAKLNARLAVNVDQIALAQLDDADDAGTAKP